MDPERCRCYISSHGFLMNVMSLYLFWFAVSASPRVKVKFTDAYSMCRSTMMHPLHRTGLEPQPLAVPCHSMTS